MTSNKKAQSQAVLSDLERAKRESVGQLLFKCARLFNERAVQRVNQTATHPVLRPAHMNLFPHIDFAGTRVVDLARKLGISKQAVSQTVAELEELGVVETVRDVSDARAKLVRFTAAGRSAITHGLTVLGEIEKELEARVGAHHMARLHDALCALESVLVADSPLTADSLTDAQPLPTARPPKSVASAVGTRRRSGSGRKR